MSNFAFRNQAFQPGGGQAGNTMLSASQLQEMYNQPSYQKPADEPMTIHNTLARIGISFAVLVTGAVIGWIITQSLMANLAASAIANGQTVTSDTLMPAMVVFIVALVVTLILGIVNAFKREPSPTLILIYAAFEGVLVGGISMFFEVIWPGIVMQAVLATLVVVGVTLALFASGKIRASKKVTKVFLIAIVAYAVFSLVNLVLMVTGVSSDPWGLRGWEIIPGVPLGLILGVFAVLLGAYSLVLDFDFIQQGVRNQAPKRYGWSGAYGVMVTVVWLYLEILRLIAIARR